MTSFEWIQATASIATAVAVFVAGWQLRLTKRQAVTAFEDELASQYRQIAQRLPIEAMLGETLDQSQYHEALGTFYHYVDLTNEQIFLRLNGRITKQTWGNWCDGIRWNLSRPAFARAWAEIKNRSPESFDELRRLETQGFDADPRSWR